MTEKHREKLRIEDEAVDAINARGDASELQSAITELLSRICQAQELYGNSESPRLALRKAKKLALRVQEAAKVVPVDDERVKAICERQKLGRLNVKVFGGVTQYLDDIDYLLSLSASPQSVWEQAIAIIRDVAKHAEMGGPVRLACVKIAERFEAARDAK